MTRDKVQCDYCNDVVPKEDATLKQYPGHRETVTIPLCNDCKGHKP
jgi:NAD-dependent SIR2 family protein deacetylase